MNIKTLVAAAALCTTSLMSQAAPVSAMTFTSSNTNGTAANSTRGYSFEVTTTGLSATHLGVYDVGSNGLGESHTVGLWTSAGQLLATTTVSSGASGLLANGFRYIDIADVLLAPGEYVVGATFSAQSPDDQAIDLESLTMAPGLAYLDSRFVNGPTALALPNFILDNRTGLAGGSLMVDMVNSDEPRNNVPEPGTWGLALVALGAAAVARRRQAR